MFTYSFESRKGTCPVVFFADCSASYEMTFFSVSNLERDGFSLVSPSLCSWTISYDWLMCFPSAFLSLLSVARSDPARSIKLRVLIRVALFLPRSSSRAPLARDSITCMGHEKNGQKQKRSNPAERSLTIRNTL